jgi:hypothetical protein
MQRPKQQALMFLLGAVLVGGALGFSADRYFVNDRFASTFGPRPKFYDAIGLTQQQRVTLDSLAFQQECAIKRVLAPHDSALRSIRRAFHAQRDSVLTKEQRTMLDQRRQDAQKRFDAEQAKEPKRQCSQN